MSLRLVALPSSVADMLDVAKDHARVDGAYDDVIVSHDIEAAIEQVERAAHVGFFGGTWEWTADAFPSGDICIGFGPVTNIVSVTYRDANGDEQTLAPEAYSVTGDWTLAPVDAWPAGSAVNVRFVSGDGNVPAPIHRAIRMMIAEGYDNRESGGELTGPAQRMVGMYRRPWA